MSCGKKLGKALVHSKKEPDMSCTHAYKPIEGHLNVGHGFRMTVYTKGEWKPVSLWWRLRWLFTGKMSSAEEEAVC